MNGAVDPRTKRRIGLVLLTFLAGLTLRLVWMLFVTDHKASAGEASNVARSVALTGKIADAFGPGQGPTAHLMPVTPLIAGGVYRLFGIETPTSEVILALWSIFIVFLSFWFLFKCFEEVGSPFWARMGALAALCILPLNFDLEVVRFRTWEGGLAIAIASGYLLAILRLARATEITSRHIVLTALLAAVLLFVSPPLGVAGYACGAILLVRRVPPRRWPAVLATVLAATVLVLAPWTIRNLVALGSPIPLRDNLGLELAIANYPGALANPDRHAEYRARLGEIHPFSSPGAFAKMNAAGGEVAYSVKLQKEAGDWIAVNPLGFARLSIRHLVGFLFPPAWYWSVYSDNGSRATYAKLIANWIFSGVGLLSLAWAMIRRRERYIYIASMTLLPILPYVIVQPILRYRYIVVGLLVFLTFDLVGRITRGLVVSRGFAASEV